MSKKSVQRASEAAVSREVYQVSTCAAFSLGVWERRSRKSQVSRTHPPNERSGVTLPCSRVLTEGPGRTYRGVRRARRRLGWVIEILNAEPPIWRPS